MKKKHYLEMAFLHIWTEMQIKEALSWAKEQLQEACERPAFESELLLAYHLKRDRLYLITHDNESIADVKEFQKLIKRSS